ncbi:MAG: phosphoribosylanthranilate isomerase [Peptococcaceae bacterium]|nr:phosphoribosylanthranilate isomerase [Peptococcaceae bacterium]
MVFVKICGITDRRTAQLAGDLGADALGFVFAPSSRRISPEAARSIISSLPAGVLKIGVFVDAPVAEVQEIADFCRLDAVQLHGTESPEYCAALNVPVIKAFRVKGRETLSEANRYRVAAVLLDAYVAGKAGGTGRTFHWQTVRDWVPPAPVILAGGLAVDNVLAAIRSVRPAGVDVSSGVETDGKKDTAKIRAFIQTVRRVGDAAGRERLLRVLRRAICTGNVDAGT